MPAAAAPYVLWLPKWYPNLNDDQDGNFVEEHARAWASVGGRLAVAFATFDPTPGAPLLRLEATTENGFPVVRAYYRQRLTGWRPLDRALKLVLYFWGLTRAYRAVRWQMGSPPMLLHVHVLLRPGLWARTYGALTGTPFLLTEHWTLYRPENAHRIGWLRRALSAWVVRGARGVQTVSDELGAAMRTLGLTGAPYVTIPNVVDTALYFPAEAAQPPTARATGIEPAHQPPAHQPPTPPTRPPALLTVAVFNEPAKNLPGLLRTFARFRTERPTATLTLVGYGAADASLRALAADLGLLASGALTFTGKLGRPEVAALMRRATAFVLFSRAENLPCVLIEALASGLPAVATRVGGVAELVEDGRTGWLVPSEDEAALLAALHRVLGPERNALLPPAEMAARAEARYSFRAVGAALQYWYEAAMPG